MSPSPLSLRCCAGSPLVKPPGGTPRKVPACEADAQAVERGQEPASREVVAGGRRVPYWNAPRYFGPWAGGWVFDTYASYSYLYIGSFAVGLAAVAVALTFKPRPSAQHAALSTS